MSLPRWDLTPYFPSIDSPELDQALSAFRSDVDELERLFDTLGISGGETHGAGEPSAFDQVLDAINRVRSTSRRLGGYLSCTVTTDTRNATAQAKSSVFDLIAADLSKLLTRFTAWIGAIDTDRLISESGKARDHRYMIEKAKVMAGHLMSGKEECIAADLKLTGAMAWGKLHSDVTSQIEVNVSGEVVPMSKVRTFAYEADRTTRRAAYEAELDAWKKWEVPLAAAMNSIKGEVGLLSRKRRWESSLDESLFSANIDRPTLDAMMSAARSFFPSFRRYLRAKASLLGVPRLAWYDIFAPIAPDTTEWSYDEACEFVERHFRSYSDKLGDFARRTFAENWVDVPPAPGKVDGAYCAGLGGDESRVLMNFKPSFGSVSTLAHELGHAYHNVCLASRSELQKSTPMTLAETASIFCETIVRQAALKEGTDAERLAILEGALQGANQVVVDITSRFLFEQSVFDGRKDRELSPAELCDAMLDAQRQTYGDGLNEAEMHPYMWAVKPHYYSWRSFYNYPYMFGLLFGLGLYARYEQDPGGFRAGYDDLLSSTGLNDAATLANRFGIDIRTEEFWRDSLSIIERDIDKFEQASQGRELVHA